MKDWEIIADNLSKAGRGRFLFFFFFPEQFEAHASLQDIWNFRHPVSVELSVKTSQPLRMPLPPIRNGPQLDADATSPDKLEDDPGKYEQIKDLAAMRNYEGWQDDCSTMTDLL